MMSVGSVSTGELKLKTHLPLLMPLLVANHEKFRPYFPTNAVQPDHFG